MGDDRELGGPDPDALWRSDAESAPLPVAEISSNARPVSDDSIELDPLTPKLTPSWGEASGDPAALTPMHDRPGGESSIRRPTIAALIGGVVALGVVAVVVVSLAADGSEDVAVPGSTEPTPITEPDVTSESTPPETSEQSPPPVDPLVLIDVELPPAVAAIQTPTEVVVLTQDRRMHTLSLPSGAVRSIDIGSGSDPAGTISGGGLVVGPDAAMVGSSSDEVLIVPRSGPAVPVEFEPDPDRGGLGPEGWIRADDGSTRFLVATYPAQGGNSDLFAVDLAGRVTDISSRFAAYRFGRSVTVDGELIVNDAGGAYRIGPDSPPSRIATGAVLATNDMFRLVRECDEVLQCSTEVVTADGGERRAIDPAILPDDFAESFGLQLAPDGTAVSMLRSGNVQERVLIDFDSGETASVQSEDWVPGSTWAADGSGVFDVAEGELQFIELSSGTAVSFGAELGEVAAVGVRRPAAELPTTRIAATLPLTTSDDLGPTELNFLAAGTAGGVGLISIDQRSLTTWETLPLGNGTLVLTASGDAIVVLPDEGAPGFTTTPDDDTVLGPPFAGGGVMLPGPTSDTIWVPDTTGDELDADVRYRLWRLDGSPVDDPGGTVVDVPDSVLLGSDGLGALVIQRGGDVFVVGADGAERLTSGELLAIGPSAAFVRECDADVACRVERIERSTGERTQIDTLGTSVDRFRPVSDGQGAALGTTVSPDGDAFVTTVPVDRDGDTPIPRAAVFDVATQTTTVVDGQIEGQPVIWNRASTFAALLVGSELTVYDRAAGRLVTFDGARLQALGPALAE